MHEPGHTPGSGFAPPAGAPLAAPTSPHVSIVGTSIGAAATEPRPSGKRRRKRISRWDRPKEPRDWRWVVGHIGRALITLGMLMFGFVAYQLWGTGIQTARAQDHLQSEFEQQLADRGVTDVTVPPAAPTSTLPAATTTVDPAVVTDPAATATLPAETTTTSIAPVEQILGNIQPGDSLGIIRIPKIDLRFYIVAGVSKDNLAAGVGHFPNTPIPGQLGNAVLAGHRTTHLAPFYDLDHLQPGDEVDVTTILGNAYSYIVTSSEIVSPGDYHVVTDSDPTTATLTLITCTPIGTSSHRLVVHAALDPTRSAPVGATSTYYGEGADNGTFDTSDTVLPDEGTLPADGSATTGAPGVTDPGGSLPDTSATSTVAGAAPVATDGPTTSVDPASLFSDDAFDAGWFDDAAAFPQVAIWALLFGLVWYGCYRLAKRLRNSWIGIAAAIIPGIVVLYFMYENINRLLPAAI
ncbi:MAG: peptidase family protein [Acidimicrobiales bacterium]|nr:peptidase family protein [Acidimicrobiales bacterium]